LHALFAQGYADGKDIRFICLKNGELSQFYTHQQCAY
jgi:hypothetical protein